MVINLLYYYIILNYIPKTIYTYQTVDYQRPSNTKPYLNTKKMQIHEQDLFLRYTKYFNSKNIYRRIACSKLNSCIETHT